MTSIEKRITEYLSSGGLFNPELANHDVVRALLIDCREYIVTGGENEKEIETSPAECRPLR